MKIENGLKSDRSMKALTGVSVKELEELVPIFEAVLLEQKSKRAQPRKRKLGSGPKGVLPTAKAKLFFILFYLKVYPTFDLAGVFFGVDRSRPCRWVQTFLPVLEKVLGRECVLPKRRISSMQEFVQHFGHLKDIFIDGTERPTARPTQSKSQKRRYSGKKKAHTRKNLVVCDQDRKVLILSPSKDGSIHDKKMLDKEDWLRYVPEKVAVWVDKGFDGIQKIMANSQQVVMPKKKPKKGELTVQEKEQNRIIAGLRIVNEHTIGAVKRFAALTHKFRNRKGQDDLFILLASALWNFHLKT